MDSGPQVTTGIDLLLLSLLDGMGCFFYLVSKF